MTEPTEMLAEVGVAARRFGVSTTTIRSWEEEGILPKAMRLPSGRRVWREADLDAARDRIVARRAERRNAEPVTA
jgi:DNA-binding transcriptional MerR regulator